MFFSCSTINGSIHFYLIVRQAMFVLDLVTINDAFSNKTQRKTHFMSLP